MAEYIEKGALMSLIESEAHRWGDDYDWWQVLADIEDFKPADVRPVVRGRWEDKQLGPWGMVYATCSACKKRVTLEQLHRNFCPNCGADMREP